MPKQKSPTTRTNEVVALVMRSIGRRAHLTLVTGEERTGRVTALISRAITVNGISADWPIEVELNGDPVDHIHLDRVATISLF